MRAFATLFAALRRHPWLSLTLFAGGLSLLGFGGTFAARYLTAKRHLTAAEQALRRYDFVSARQSVQQALVLQPNNARAQLLAVQVARRLDDYAEAERLLTAFEQAHGVTADSQFEWLLLTVQQGDLSDEKDFVARMEQQPQDAPLMREALGKGYANTARWPDMLRLAGRVLQANADDAAAHLLRGQGLEGRRNREPALEEYQRAVDLAPDAAAARLCLADMLSQLGFNHEAIDHYERLRLRQPTDPAVLLGLARCRYDAAELDQAQVLLGELRAAHPEHVAGLVESGRLALQRGRPAEAEPFLSRATALAPWHREAHRYLVRCLEELGRTEAAQQCRARLRDLEAQDSELGRLNLRFFNAPIDPDANVETGKSLLRNGQEQAGRHLLMSVLAFYPRHRPAHAALADYFAQAGQPRRSEHHRRLAAGDSP